MRKILDEKRREQADGTVLVKLLMPCPDSGHPFWSYSTARFVPAPDVAPGAGKYETLPDGFATGLSPYQRFQRALAQVRTRPLDLNPGVAAELADLAKLKSEYPAIYKKLVLAIAAGEREFPAKAKPSRPIADTPQAFDAGEVSVSFSAITEPPRGLGLREDELQQYLSKFTHGDLGELGVIVPFGELSPDEQFCPMKSPATEAASALKFRSGLVVGKYPVLRNEPAGPRQVGSITIGCLVLGDVARTLVCADRDNVSF